MPRHHGHKRTGYVGTVAERVQQRKTDAYNAGYRRGFADRAPGGTYETWPEFAEGYAKGQQRREAGESS